MNLRIVIKILGLLAILVGLTMGVCWFYAWAEWQIDKGDAAARATERAFAISTGITVGVGILMFLSGIGTPNEVLRREAIAIVGLSWIQISLFGALPFYLCEPGLGAFASIFESVSGFTTTGSSVMTDIEAFPRPVLMWRSLTQWLGGIGILVVFVAVLSFLGVGSRSLVAQESSLNISDAGASRIRDVAMSLLKVYLTLTLICFLGLLGLGMNVFESVCHSMTTIATGGFSPKNASIAHYADVRIEMWLAFFMFLSSIGFMLYIFAIKGKWSRIRAEEEARFYFFLILGATLAIALDLLLATDDYTYFVAIENAFFNVVSIGSTTGFGASDYDQWPLFSRVVLMVMMLIGGCAGSTAGGIKMNRVILFSKIAMRELIRSFRPNQVFRIRLNGVAPDEKVFVTTSFLIALGFSLSGIAFIIVSVLEPSLDMLSVIGCVYATLFNVGPGFEAVGPTDNFGFLKPATLVVLSFLMILGRLEFFALLVLFVPSLWRRY